MSKDVREQELHSEVYTKLNKAIKSHIEIAWKYYISSAKTISATQQFFFLETFVQVYRRQTNDSWLCDILINDTESV